MISTMRPLAPPASLISLAASNIPSRTLTPHGVKLLVRSVSAPILIGSDGTGSVGSSMGSSVAAAGAWVGAAVGAAVVAGAAQAASTKETSTSGAVALYSRCTTVPFIAFSSLLG